MRHYQELNGFTDWFEDAVDTAREAVSDVTEAVTYGAKTSYDWLSKKSSELTAESKKTLIEFQKKVEKLFNLQSEVDKRLATLPEDSAVRKKLEAERDKSRGLFEEYVKPAYQKFAAWAGMDDKANFSGMGAVPLVPLAAVLGAVSVGMYYVNKSIEIEEKILNDPELKKEFAAAKGSGFAAIGQNLQYIGWGIGILGAAYLASTVFRRN